MTQLLNSPVELGLRALVILANAHPRTYDTTRLVLLDHGLVHSSDLDGPPSPFPPLPARVGQFGVKRTNMEAGVRLMVRAGLIEALMSREGFSYRATEGAEPFLELLESAHVHRIREVAAWVTEHFGELDEAQLRETMSSLLAHWADELDTNGEATGAPS